MENRNYVGGLLMRPCYETIEGSKEAWSKTEASVSSNFFKEYSDKIERMQIIAMCAKHYIIENYEKIKDWKELSVIIDYEIEYFNYTPSNFVKRSRFSRLFEDRRKSKHNPILIVDKIVLDSIDGDLTIVINDNIHFNIKDDAVITIANYIETELNK